MEVVGPGHPALLADPAMVRDDDQVLGTNNRGTQDPLPPLRERAVGWHPQVQIMYVIPVPCFLPP